MGAALALEADDRRLIAPLRAETSVPPDQEWAERDDMSADAGDDSHDPVLKARDLVEKFPGSYSAKAALAGAEYLAGEIETAVELCATVLDAKPVDDVAAAITVAWVAHACGASNLAIAGLAPLEEALDEVRAKLVRDARIAIHSRLLLTAGQPQSLLDLLAGDDTNPRTIGLRGWALIHLGRCEEAIRALRHDLVAHGPRVDLLINLAFAHAHLGQLRKARTLSEQARHLAPADLSVTFNVASYQALLGDYMAAAQVLRNAQRFYPSHPKLACALAEMYVRLGKVAEGHQELRRARQANQGGSPYDRAVLAANEAYLLFKLRRRSQVETVESLRRELLRSDYKNLEIGRLLARTMSSVSSVTEYTVLLGGLRGHFDENECIEIASWRAFAASDFKSAAELAVRWVQAEPFSSDAAAMATYLLADAIGDHEQAVKIGREALRRMPNAHPLANNIAYAETLAGRPDAAIKLLRDRPDDPWILATRALADLYLGHLRQALDTYDAAANAARSDYGVELEAMVRVNEVIALSQIYRHDRPDFEPPALPTAEDAWMLDPRMRLLAMLASKAGIGWTVDTDGSN